MKSDKFWSIVLIVVIIIVGIIAFMFQRQPAKYAQIYQYGLLIETINLTTVNEPYTITINELYGTDADGESGVNEIAIERGRIRMLSANCPDGECVRQGWLSKGSTPIVCLPHRLVIALEGGEETDTDAIVG